VTFIDLPLVHAARTLAAAVVAGLVSAASFAVENATSAAGAAVGAFDPGRSGFLLTVDEDLAIEYEIFALFARPGQVMALESDVPTRRVGAASQILQTRHTLEVPEAPGRHQVQFESDTGEIKTLNLLVLHRAEADNVQGYHLGVWPSELYRGEESYRAPQYFAEVSEDMRDVALSPHFTLGQFLCKQDDDATPHLIVSERLIIKLERVLEAANARGWRADTFTIMSGFRTPAYNAAIGNGEFSRHIYGGAADVFIDADADGRMDDLNGDNRIDRADAAALFDLVESLSAQTDFAPYLGGLGEYGPTSWRPPFVHIDERGWRARWGR
jgi:hypothetical protein